MADLVSKGMLGVTALLSIRYIADPAQYALFTLAISAVTLTSQVLASSFNTIFVVAADKLGLADGPSRFLAFQLLAVLVLGALALPLAPRVGWVYPLGIALAIGYCMSEFTKSQSQHALDFRRFSIIELSRSGLFLTGQLILLVLASFHLVAWEILAVQAASLWVVFVLFMRGRVKAIHVMDVRAGLEVAKTVLGSPFRLLFVQSAVVAVLMQVDVWMLHALGNAHAVATYGSAYRYYTLAMMVSTSMRAILLPTVQRAPTAAALDALFRKQLRVLAMIAPVVLVLAVGASWWIPLIDAGRYPGAVEVFRILSVSALVSVAFNPHMSVLLRFEDFRFTVGASLGALLIAVSLHSVLIPRFGEAGAAVATLVAFSCLNGAAFWRSRMHREQMRSEENAA
ncbi:MAG: polysaccharide biosynthesis C-terminal domain-containing protein [Fimbriimonadaceae bacterium]|nr:polysaccharide biosynthesis C-terminal domain-containing protein [Fimbriimonadaceae bacterium]